MEKDTVEHKTSQGMSHYDEVKKRDEGIDEITDGDIRELLDSLYGPESTDDVNMDDLSEGKIYRHYVFKEAFVEGEVVMNDGVTAILRVTNSYEEGFFEILYYNEVRRYFPSFRDDKAERLTEYLCLDVETTSSLFFRDPESDVIMTLDENYAFGPADVFKFRMERLKRVLLYRLQKIEEEKKGERENEKGPHINIDVSETAIEDMYDEYDRDKGNENGDDDLRYSLNRTLTWLNSKNCAIITAWRGNYNRAENNNRNDELQKDLRKLGYGVIRVKGCYPEMGKEVEKENSFLVIDLEDDPDFTYRLYEKSESYEQDCFLYKPIEEKTAYLIGTNDNFGKERIEVAGILRINSLSAEQYSEIGSGRLSFEPAQA